VEGVRQREDDCGADCLAGVRGGDREDLRGVSEAAGRAGEGFGEGGLGGRAAVGSMFVRWLQVPVSLKELFGGQAGLSQDGPEGAGGKCFGSMDGNDLFAIEGRIAGHGDQRTTVQISWICSWVRGRWKPWASQVSR